MRERESVCVCVREREIDCWAGVCETVGRVCEGERLLGGCVCVCEHVREGGRETGTCVCDCWAGVCGREGGSRETVGRVCEVEGEKR